MRVFRELEDIREPLPHAVVTIGNFDGVHLGHREIFRRVRSAAAELHGTSVVVTFLPHPLKVLAPERSPLLINTYAEKETLIGASAIDCLVTVPFTHEFAALSAADFVRRVLVERIGVQRLIIGHDYAFGRGREGNAELLGRLGEQYGFALEVLEPIGIDGTVFSSSAIRRMIAEGQVAGVVPLLGRHFSLGGTVVHGQERGKVLGFPTANIATDKELIPREGVYAVKVKIDEQVYDGACNIGTNPTFAGTSLSVEAFLFDFAGDLYGRDLRLYFVDRLRDERKFSGPDELQQAIVADVARCRDILRTVSIIEYREYLGAP
jgi:riboflavin kinase/FMN adenylyltransferase